MVLAQHVPGKWKLFDTDSFHPTMVLAQPRCFPILGASTSFPSHYGSRSTKGNSYCTIYNTICFHPTMVLAQLILYCIKYCSAIRFHPTMVLAQRGMVMKIQRLRNRFHPTMVLAQRKCFQSCVQTNMFPSHYGSRSTLGELDYQACEGCFHPTMVLAQLDIPALNVVGQNLFPSHYGSRSTIEAGNRAAHNVAFPSHYGSRSTRIFAIVLCESQFPSHYGSRSTNCGNRECRRRYYVSIPLWFSLNGYSLSHAFKPKWVSIPLWFSLNEESRPVYQAHHRVSIPLWFSLNYTNMRSLRYPFDCFHPTMVLAQL